MPAIEHFEALVLMFKTVKTPPTVKSPSPTLPQPPLYSTMAAFAIPKTMKGVQMKSTGRPEVLQYKTDLPVAAPRDGEVLVKTDFIGINYVDVFVALAPTINVEFSIPNLPPDTGASE